jgi:hypothetical protein
MNEDGARRRRYPAGNNEPLGVARSVIGTRRYLQIAIRARHGGRRNAHRDRIVRPGVLRRHAGRSRYSSLAQIDRKTVRDLEVVWTYRTGELERRGGPSHGGSR